MDFEHHQHGNGPFHYSAEFNEQVFEIYPLKGNSPSFEADLRLGFEVEKLESLLKKLADSNWIIVHSAKDTKWGTIAVIEDLEGRKIELKQK
jgi:hypothetical protein